MLPSATAPFACLLVLASGLGVLAQTPAPAPAPYESDPKFRAVLAEARTLTTQRQYTFAADSYKKAFKLSGGQCAHCLDDAYDLQIKTGDYKAAINSALASEALAATPLQKSLAETRRARALFYQAGEKPKPAQLTAIDSVLKSALAASPDNNGARYLDGCVLAHLGQIDAAREQFTLCARNVPPTDPSYVRARHFAENPMLSTNKMAPPITVTALDGTKFNLDEMGGRVVLIDFWATWCGPCNEELPQVKKIARDFAGQPLTIISISWDSDETKWKDFINKHEMTWLQYRDATHSLSKAFGVEAIPHYFTIDSDGVLTAEMLGSGNDVEGKLKKLVARAKAAAPPPSAVATTTSPTTPQ